MPARYTQPLTEKSRGLGEVQKWMRDLNDDPLAWLLEPDLDNPGVR